jgi:hypothetical protein
MKPMDQYAARGLSEPIRFRPGIGFHLLLWIGGPLLIAGCVFAIVAGDTVLQLVGAFGVIFFGFGLFVMLQALMRSGARGLFELSAEGLYLAQYGATFAWPDLGPAWITEATAGKSVKDVCFVLRNAKKYVPKMGAVGKTIVAMSKTISKQQLSAPAEWGLGLLSALADIDIDAKEIGKTLAEMREHMAGEADAVVLNIPAPYRFGVPSDAFVAIINNEVEKRARSPGRLSVRARADV